MKIAHLILLVASLDVVHSFFSIELDIIDMTEETSLPGKKNETVHGQWIYLKDPPYEATFKVSHDKDLYENGYGWIVDESRCKGFLRTTTLEPEFFRRNQTGEQIFVLMGYGFDMCTYRMAFAKISNFTDFDDTEHVRQVLEFPVTFSTDMQEEDTPMPEPLPP